MTPFRVVLPAGRIRAGTAPPPRQGAEAGKPLSGQWLPAGARGLLDPRAGRRAVRWARTVAVAPLEPRSCAGSLRSRCRARGQRNPRAMTRARRPRNGSVPSAIRTAHLPYRHRPRRLPPRPGPRRPGPRHGSLALRRIPRRRRTCPNRRPQPACRNRRHPRRRLHRHLQPHRSGSRQGRLPARLPGPAPRRCRRLPRPERSGDGGRACGSRRGNSSSSTGRST